MIGTQQANCYNNKQCNLYTSVRSSKSFIRQQMCTKAAVRTGFIKIPALKLVLWKSIIIVIRHTYTIQVPYKNSSHLIFLKAYFFGSKTKELVMLACTIIPLELEPLWSFVAQPRKTKRYIHKYIRKHKYLYGNVIHQIQN